VSHNFSTTTPSAVKWENGVYLVLDQLRLPENISYIECLSPEDVARTIVNMNLRGAPLIGAAASAAIVLNYSLEDPADFRELFNMLLQTRPTAVNLRNVLEEAGCLYESNRSKTASELRDVFKTFSDHVHARDLERNLTMGENGADHLESIFGKKRLKVITHCNAGALATCGYGTALGVIRSLKKRDMLEHVFIDETRPYLQGARLTAFEMVCENIPHTLITDSTASWVMKTEDIDIVITGADRVAANGDLANKIGTYPLAICANYHKIPYMSAMPLETFDLSIMSGRSIVIEKRSDSELLFFNGKRIAPEKTAGLHLGFDVVPAELIHSLITEKGVISGGISEEKIAGLFK